jgi:hypothetical protein
MCFNILDIGLEPSISLIKTLAHNEIEEPYLHHYLFSTISVILFYIQALHAKIHTIEILASAYLDFIFTSDGRWDSFVSGQRS